MRTLAFVSLSGPEPVVGSLGVALRARGIDVGGPESGGPRLWLHVGPADSLPWLPITQGLLLAPSLGSAELAVLGGGGIDVILDSAPVDEIVARLLGLQCRLDAASEGDARTAEVEGELRRQREFISHLSDGVAVVGGDGTLLILNPAAATILNAQGGTDGIRLQALAAPTDELSESRLRRAIEHDTHLSNADVHVRLQDGRRIVLAMSSGHLRHPEGRTILSFRDVTAERSIETELRRTRDFLERLVDGSSDAIVASDMRGRLLVFNRAAERLFGLSAQDAMRTQNVIELYPQGGAREMMRLLREARSGRIEAVRVYAKTQTGELVPVEVSAALIRANGEEVATLGLLRDQRERVRVETELARTRARLVDAEKQAAISALAGGTAHELNQPLTVILGYVDLLSRRADPQQRRALDMIAQQAERMAESVRQIAQLTRVETQSYPGDREIADIEKSSERKAPKASGT